MRPAFRFTPSDWRFYRRGHRSEHIGGRMIELRVRKYGDSLAVILPREVIRRLGANEGGGLRLIEAPGGYRLIPRDPGFKMKMAKASRLVGRYRNALRALSK